MAKQYYFLPPEGGVYSETTAVLEVHYFFNDFSHSMDAFVQNKCEQGILRILKHASQHFGITLLVEIEPSRNGGFTNRYRIKVEKQSNASPISHQSSTKKIVLITALITTSVNFIAVAPSEIAKQAVARFMDPEKYDIDKAHAGNQLTLDSLEIEKKALELEKMRRELNIREQPLKQLGSKNANGIQSIVDSRSMLFKQLYKYPKVIAVSFRGFDNADILYTEEYKIYQDEFKQMGSISSLDTTVSMPITMEDFNLPDEMFRAKLEQKNTTP